MPTNPEEYARIAKSQREALFELAYRIENGEPLNNATERRFAAAAVRAAAVQIPDHAPKNRGQQPRFDHQTVAVEFASIVHSGASRTKARAILAERYGVSDEAIRESLKKDERGEIAVALMEGIKVIR